MLTIGSILQKAVQANFMIYRFHDISRALFALLLLFSACNLGAQIKSKSPGLFSLFKSSRDSEIKEKPRPKPIRKESIDTSKEYGIAALVDLALQNNPKTSIAWQTARIQAAELNLSRSDYYPQLSAALDSGGTWETERDLTVAGLGVTDTNPLSPTFTPSLSLTWMLFDLERDFATKAARLSLVSARHSFDRTMQDIIFDVQQAYLQLEEEIALYDSEKTALELATTTDRAITAKFKAGIVGKADLLQAHQNLEQARYNLQAKEESRSTSRATLLLTVGLPANAPLKIKPLESDVKLAKIADSVDKLIDNAMRARPDIAAQYADVREMEAGVEEAHAAWLPTLSLSATYSRAHTDDNVSLRNSTMHNSLNSDVTLEESFVGLTLSFDILDGFTRKFALEEAEANLENAKLELIQTELQASSEVWNNYFKYRSAQKKVDYAKRLYTTSKSAQEAVDLGYQQGLKTVLDVLDGHNKLAVSQATLISARAELLTTSVQLAYATGSTSPEKPRVIRGKTSR